MILSNLVYIRILAIFLIVNSHLDSLYPFPQLAFGGHLGNSIFYFISGIGLTLSLQKHPLTILSWAKVRLIKVAVPIIFYLALLHPGNWNGFVRAIFHYLVWHDLKQMESFLPVLWGLYLLFRPIYNLSDSQIKNLIIALLTLTFIFFLYRINTAAEIPHDLPAKDVFFAFNALINFLFGIYLAKQDQLILNLKRENRRAAGIISLSVILVSQGLHQYFSSIDPRYIFFNYYLNFLTVISLYLFVSLIKIPNLDFCIPFLHELASTSLAVYLIHFVAIDLLKAAEITFPYNVLGVYFYSFAFAYSITKLSVFFVNRLLSSRLIGR